MPEPIATLSMYDWPETEAALDRFWKLVAGRLQTQGIPPPDRLTRVEHPSMLWTEPGLLLGQTCGWPFANNLRGKVIPFGRLDHAVENCPAGYYNSVYIGGDEKYRIFLEDGTSLGQVKRIAINSDDSQSGFHVFREITGQYSTEAIPMEKRLVTGAHRNSVVAVANGEAEIAAIDAIAFELAKLHEPDAASKVKIIGYSQPKPGLPLITSLANSSVTSQIYQAIGNAIGDMEERDRAALFIRDIVPASDEDYIEFL